MHTFISYAQIAKRLAWISLFILAACGPGLPAEPTPVSPTGSAPTPPALTPLPGAATPGSRSGLSGTIYSASDVSGRPDKPLPDQMALAASRQDFARLSGLSEADLQPERLRFARVQLAAPDPAMVTTLSDTDGKYALDIAPGEVIVCLAQSETDFPLATRGCGLISLAPGEEKQVDISSGFGEILLIEQNPKK